MSEPTGVGDPLRSIIGEREAQDPVLQGKVLIDAGMDAVDAVHEEDTLERMDTLLYGCHFKEAIRTAMALAHEANRYLDGKAPWKAVKENRQAAADSLYVALYVISCLRTALYPFMPFSSQRLHEMLGFEGTVQECGWKPTVPEPGQKLQAPQPLFTKLDESVIEEETSHLGT